MNVTLGIATSLICLFLVKATPTCNFIDKFLENYVCDPGNVEWVLTKELMPGKFDTTISICLKSCSLLDVEVESFENLVWLQRLDMADNKLKTLKMGLLDNVPSLIFLNLSYNSISELPVGLFNYNKYITHLDLTGNKLKTIAASLLKPLEKLKYLYAIKNQMHGVELYPETFKTNTDIDILDLSENDLNRVPDDLLLALKKCSTLVLDRANLRKIPRFATTDNFKGLTYLSLSSNSFTKIVDVDIFVNLTNLLHLSLANNELKYINVEVFNPLQDLTHLDLSKNYLTQIPENYFRSLKRIKEIDLSFNFISIINVNTFNIKSLLYLDITHNRVTYLQEDFCLKLMLSGVNLIRFAFENNPWQCACFRELLRDVKKTDIAYNDNYFNGEHPVCVTTSQFICRRYESINNIFWEMYTTKT